MVEGNRQSVEPGKEGLFLGVSTIALFASLLIVTAVRLAVGWGGGPWELTWEILGVAFILALLLYLGNGGAESALELSRNGEGRRRPTAAAIVARLGVTLLLLAFVGNFIAAIWESRPTAFVLAQNIIGTGFAVCFVTYLALRFARAKTPATKSD